MTDTIVSDGALPEFRVGAVLSQTFSTFFANFLKFLLMGAAVYLPFMVLAFLITGSFAIGAAAGVAPGETGAIAILVSTFTILLVTMVVSSIVQSGVMYGAVEYQAGRSASVGGMLAVGLKVLFPVLGASIMIAILYMIGAIFLVIPGIIVLLMMCVTVPAIVAEKLGPIEAMKRSANLTSGYKWQILGVFVLMILILIGVQLILGMLSIAGAGVDNGIVSAGVSLVVSASMYGFLGSVIASTYTSLRASKEGVDADEIAKVFA